MSRTDMAILGMLTVEPMSGYGMKQFCEQSLTHFWHESYGNLYPRLRRLAAGGFVRARRESRAHAPDAIVYSLTPTGRSRFHEWLEDPPEPEHVRSELMLKIFFGAQTRPEASASILRAYLREQLSLRRSYREIETMLRSGAEDRPEVVFWMISIRRGQLLTEARLRWCRESLKVLENLSSPEAES